LARQQFPPLFARAGYEEGRNLVVEWRFPDGKDGDLLRLAEELVHLKPELIVADGNEAVAAAIKATRTIPIVMHVSFRPVDFGYVKSLGRPGGNVTGTSWSGPELLGKTLELLKLALPSAVRIAVLWNPTYPFEDLQRAEINKAASVLGMKLEFFHVTRIEEVRPALERIASARPDALYIGTEKVTISRGREIAAFSIEQKLITIATAPPLLTDGGLLYYGPVLSAIEERTASHVDRILRGANPADLPVELPSKYELAINAKTARAIGYRIPPALLQRADRVIE
jgi:putative ABC transport system substrate-binding protein